MLICIYKHGVAYATIYALRYGYKYKHLLLFIPIENQQMHQNNYFIVMSSQTLLHVSAYQRHHQGAHMILTSYLYVGVHYMQTDV
jgi:hypothetical protein